MQDFYLYCSHSKLKPIVFKRAWTLLHCYCPVVHCINYDLPVILLFYHVLGHRVLQCGAFSVWPSYERYLWRKNAPARFSSLPSFCIPEIPFPRFSRKTCVLRKIIIKNSLVQLQTILVCCPVARHNNNTTPHCVRGARKSDQLFIRSTRARMKPIIIGSRSKCVHFAVFIERSGKTRYLIYTHKRHN